MLKQGGRLEEHDQSGRPVHTGPWNSGVQDQLHLLQEAGFLQIESGKLETGETRLPEIGFVLGRRLS